MKKSQAIAALTRLKPQLVSQYGITRLALFGSIARDEAKPNSDIDILIAFDGPANSSRYFGVQFALEDELGLSIDLITEKALRKELKPYIEKDAIYV